MFCQKMPKEFPALRAGDLVNFVRDFLCILPKRGLKGLPALRAGNHVNFVRDFLCILPKKRPTRFPALRAGNLVDFVRGFLYILLKRSLKFSGSARPAGAARLGPARPAVAHISIATPPHFLPYSLESRSRRSYFP